MTAKRLSRIKDLSENLVNGDGERMPVLFLGHGSPMNAVEENAFTRSLARMGKHLPRPRAILCVSAHWMSEGTWITGMERPKTIHDFYGFPQELFDVQYPAPGEPDLARKISQTFKDPQVQLELETWGLDHGTWSVLKHMYPLADIPVLQLSVYMSQPASYHFQLGQELAKLREQGVLIVGSGNIVHNLRTIKWGEKPAPYDWAVEFDEWAKSKLLERDFSALQNDFLKFEAGRLSVPSMDHYYPLLYVLGAAGEKDDMTFEYEGIQNSSISMRCLRFG